MGRVIAFVFVIVYDLILIGCPVFTTPWRRIFDRDLVPLCDRLARINVRAFAWLQKKLVVHCL